eukprot:1160412-Pelagomonas_calceolata.AAC.4
MKARLSICKCGSRGPGVMRCASLGMQEYTKRVRWPSSSACEADFWIADYFFCNQQLPLGRCICMYMMCSVITSAPRNAVACSDGFD